jgi:hypothetical protein
LNNIIEQDHRFIKKITKPMMGFKAFHCNMNSEILFSQALGLPSPWKVEEICFSSAPMSAQSELHIYLGFEPNRMDLLEENDEGDFVYDRDISIAYPRMEELFAAISSFSSLTGT